MDAVNKAQPQDDEYINNPTVVTNNSVLMPRAEVSTEQLVLTNNRGIEKELVVRKTQSVHDEIDQSLLRERFGESNVPITPPETRRERLLGQTVSPYFQKIGISKQPETSSPKLGGLPSSTASDVGTGQIRRNTEIEKDSAQDGSSVLVSLSLTANGSKNRRASPSPSGSPLNKKLKITQSKAGTRGRLASSGVDSKPKDWTKATEKPPGLEKAEKDTCLTCINYGRNCHGTSLVQVEMKTSGKSDIRCITCASKAGHGGRRCYWKEPAKNIDTYAQAKAEYHGIENQKNTRQGRLDRARLDPASRLSLARTATYVPPDQERRKSMNYKSSRQDADSKQYLTAASLVIEACQPGVGPNNKSESSVQAVSVSGDNDYDSEEIDESDIKNAFDDVKAEVKALLRTHCGDQLNMRDLYTAMFVYVPSLDANRKIVDGINAKLRSLRDEAVAEGF